MTLADLNPEKGTITIIFSVAGRSTVLFSELQEGEFYQDVVGPLGKPSDVRVVGTVICVGGGTGVAVLYPIAKMLKRMGNRIISIIGARCEELIILREEMEMVSDELLICTDNGSVGRNAQVTELLGEVLAKETPGAVIAIGPVAMMKRVSDITRPLNIKTIVSLNPIMIDGTGMCGSCRVEVGGVVKFACVDGPEFDGHEVNFDQLMQRLQAFRNEEKQSLDACGGAKVHRCKMEEEISVEDLGKASEVPVAEVKA
jgi:ferredoxin--NADP+ reductase